MRKPGFLFPATIVVCLGAFGGCSISTEEGEKGKKHDVDIHTPFGSLSVREGSTDVKDTGLALYPGAQIKKDSDDESRSANVEITSSLFGVKVVALKFESNDAPDKVLAFYRNELGKYGNVVECTGGFDGSHRHEGNAPVGCDATGSGHGYREELKVGTENKQRIVAIKPSGNGSEFALVYFRSSEGKETL
jgi:hypothetical protein